MLKEWTHICVTYDGSKKAGGVKIYYDGKQQPVNVAADKLQSTIKAQVPFKIVICGSYGTFGPGGTSNVPGTASTNQGGPVGPDGSTLNRHSSRW